MTGCGTRSCTPPADAQAFAEITTAVLLADMDTARLQAATTLAVFPHHVPPGPAPADSSDAHPATLRRAIAFIEANAASDIGIAADYRTAYGESPSHTLRRR